MKILLFLIMVKLVVHSRLKAGMTLAIEPMAHLGGCETEVLQDDWTVVTKDRSLAAHYEHTIVITDDGYEILTKL